MKRNTNGELLLTAVSNYGLLKLTKFESEEFSYDLSNKSKRIIVDEKKSQEVDKVCEILEPFLDKNHAWYKLIKSHIQNTESQKDFDVTKLFNFKQICIESIDHHLPIYEGFLKNSKEYKKMKDEIAKKKNKISTTVDKQTEQYEKIVNQLNKMKKIFSDATTPTDLIRLELYSKPS